MTDAPTRSTAPLGLGLLVLALAFGATLLRTAPAPPLGKDAPADQFSAGRATEVLWSLVGDDVPHPVGSPQSRVVRERIVTALAGLGYTPEIQTTFACSGTDQACGTVNNVVAVRAGRESGPAVLLMSHYDSVAAGPGASDAGVSVAAIIEVARALAAGPPLRHPVVFLLNEGEEAGLLGAAGFLADHPLAKTIGAVVNLEARGTSGASVMFETSGETAWLVDALAGALRRPMASSLFYPIYERLPNDTDLTLVKQAGLPGVNFAFIGSVPHYHTPLDRAGNARPATLQHHGENALAIVRALAGADLVSPPSGNAVFFDVLAFGIVRWPAGWTLPIAALAFLLVATTTVAMRVISGAALWRAIAGLVAWVLAVAAAGGAGWATLRGLADDGRWPGGGTTTPQLDVIAFWAIGLAAAMVVMALVARVLRPAGAWTGTWMGWATLGVAVGVFAPEASYLFSVPALVAGTLGTVTVTFTWRAPTADHPGALVTTAPLAVAAVLVMPPAWLLFDALGPPALPIVAGALGLLATGLAPAFAAAGLVRWLVPVAVTLAGAVLLASTANAPAFSEDRPERLSLVFLQVDDEARAKWIASPVSGRLDGNLMRPGLFGPTRDRAYPWSAATAFVADADRLPDAAPDVEVLEEGRHAEGRFVRLRARSGRGAPIVTLMLPRARVVSVRMNGREVPPRPGDSAVRLSQRDASTVLRSYTCHTTPPEGIEVELVIEGDERVDGFVIDRSHGLPAAGAALISARPPTAQPFGSGDVTIVAKRLRL